MLISKRPSLSLGSTPRGIITSFPSSRQGSSDRLMSASSHVMTKHLSSARMP